MDKRQQYNTYINYLNPQPEPDQVLPPEVMTQPPAEAAPPQAAPAPSEAVQAAPPQTEEQVPPVPEEANQEQAVDFSGVDAAARAGYLESTAPGMVSQSKRLGKGPEGRAFRELTDPMTREGMAKVGGIAIAGAKREEELRLQGERAAADEAAFIDGMEKRREIEAEQRAQKERNLADWNTRTANIMREPDPGRYFNSATTGQKLSLGLMAIAGGWVKNKTGKNPVLEAVEKAMDQDLKSQKDLIDREERGLQYAKEGYAMGDEIFEDRLESNILDRADKLAASQAMLTRKIAELHKSAAPAETINMMEQAAAELDKQRAGLFVQFDEKKRAREQKAAAARAAAQARQQQAQAKMQQNRALLGVMRNEAGAMDEFVNAGGDPKDLEKLLADRAKAEQDDIGKTIQISGIGGKRQTTLGKGINDKMTERLGMMASALPKQAEIASRLQDTLASQGLTKYEAVNKFLSRNDPEARAFRQDLEALLQTSLDKTTFEEGPNGILIIKGAMGADGREAAVSITADGLQRHMENEFSSFEHMLAAGAYGVNWDEVDSIKKDVMSRSGVRVTSAPGLAVAAQGEAAKSAAGATLMGGWDKKDPEAREEAEKYVGAAISAYISDPKNVTNRNAAKNAIDMHRDSGLPRDSFMRAAEFAAKDLTATGRTGVFEKTSGGESAGRSDVRGGGWHSNTRASDAVRQIADWYNMTEEQAIEFLNKTKGLE